MAPKNLSLIEILTQYDVKMSQREGKINIYRLGNFFNAANLVENLMSEGILPEDACAQIFEIDFPPIKKWLSQPVRRVYSQNTERKSE